MTIEVSFDDERDCNGLISVKHVRPLGWSYHELLLDEEEATELLGKLRDFLETHLREKERRA